MKILQFSIEFPVFFIKERDVTKAKTGTDILDPFQHINHAGILLLLWTVLCWTFIPVCSISFVNKLPARQSYIIIIDGSMS